MSKGPLCPYFRKPCLEHGCTHYIQIQGVEPQTGKQLSDWMCIDHVKVKVALEGNKEVRQQAASTESLRNVIHEGIPLRVAHEETPTRTEAVTRARWIAGTP